MIRAVTKATYLQLWWPSFDQPVYTGPGRLPTWDPVDRTYRDPDTGFPLPTWEQALDELDADPEAKPAVGEAVSLCKMVAEFLSRVFERAMSIPHCETWAPDVQACGAHR